MYVIDPDKLKRRRKAKHLTQGDLAYLARCTQQYISLIESGDDRDVSEEIALKITKALDVELEDYFEARAVVSMQPVATPSRPSSSSLAEQAG